MGVLAHLLRLRGLNRLPAPVPSLQGNPCQLVRGRQIAIRDVTMYPSIICNVRPVILVGVHFDVVGGSSVIHSAIIVTTGWSEPASGIKSTKGSSEPVSPIVSTTGSSEPASAIVSTKGSSEPAWVTAAQITVDKVTNQVGQMITSVSLGCQRWRANVPRGRPRAGEPQQQQTPGRLIGQ